MKFRVACAQIAPYKAEVDRNLAAIADAIVDAASNQVDVVCFAETATTGYFLEGGSLECALSAADLSNRLEALLIGRLNAPIDALVGFYELHDGQVFNGVAYLECGAANVRTLHVYRKFFLASYGVFDEDRFMARGRTLGAFETRFGKAGILICEDAWHSVMPMTLALDGANVIYVPAASPARGFSEDQVGNLGRYRRMIRAFTEEHGVFGVNCQLNGFEGGKGFVGGSALFDPFGNVMAESPTLEDHLLIGDIDLDLIEIARQNTPLLADLKGHLAELKQALADL